jgi:hypothetical protein
MWEEHKQEMLKENVPPRILGVAQSPKLQRTGQEQYTTSLFRCTQKTQVYPRWRMGY